MECSLTDPLRGNELSDGRIAVTGEYGSKKEVSSGESRLRGEANASTLSKTGWVLGRVRVHVLGSHLEGQDPFLCCDQG